jgi:hypothetical protein
MPSRRALVSCSLVADRCANGHLDRMIGALGRVPLLDRRDSRFDQLQSPSKNAKRAGVGVCRFGRRGVSLNPGGSI